MNFMPNTWTRVQEFTKLCFGIYQIEHLIQVMDSEASTHAHVS